MPKRALHQTAGVVLHVLNRGVRRLRLFERDDDYRAFLEVVAEGQARTGIRILAYAIMPNHFHLVVWPNRDGQLTRFMRWFQSTHGKRWHAFRQTQGTGSVYQGRFKAFPVQTDSHFLVVCRYVERNPLRARLVARAQDWPWSSLHQRNAGLGTLPLSEWPVRRPEHWMGVVNGSESQADLDGIRQSVVRGAPYGDAGWVDMAARQCQLEARVRPRGRPKR